MNELTWQIETCLQELAKLRALNAELLAALRLMAFEYGEPNDGARKQAEAAIAKAEALKTKA